MGRFCCDRTVSIFLPASPISTVALRTLRTVFFLKAVSQAGEEFIYFTTDTDVLRLRYANGALGLDEGWGGSYAVEGADQSAGWDTCLGSGSLWMMDMGRPPNWGMNRAVAAVAVGLKTLGSFGVPGMKRLGKPHNYC